MRLVKVKLWDSKNGTNYEVNGYFHRWGEECQVGPYEYVAMDTLAIVELNDGSIELVPPRRVTFLEGP